MMTPMIPLDPPKDGWRQDPATGKTYFQQFWLHLDTGTAAVKTGEERDVPPSKEAPGPTPEQRETWARQIAADSCDRAVKNLEHLIHHSPDDRAHLEDLHWQQIRIAREIRSSVPNLKLVG